MRGAAENTGARATPGASSANTHLRVEAAARRAGSAACSILCMEFVLSLSIIYFLGGNFPAFWTPMASTLRVLLLALQVLTTSGITCRSPARRSLAFSHARAAGA